MAAKIPILPFINIVSPDKIGVSKPPIGKLHSSSDVLMSNAEIFPD
jgi:hypothetical protein